MAVQLDKIAPLGPIVRRIQAHVPADGQRPVGTGLGLRRRPLQFHRRDVRPRPVGGGRSTPSTRSPGREIQSRFAASVDAIMSQVRATPEDWTWKFHRDPDALLAHRRTALNRFLGGLSLRRLDGPLPHWRTAAPRSGNPVLRAGALFSSAVPLLLAALRRVSRPRRSRVESGRRGGARLPPSRFGPPSLASCGRGSVRGGGGGLAQRDRGRGL